MEKDSKSNGPDLFPPVSYSGGKPTAQVTSFGKDDEKQVYSDFSGEAMGYKQELRRNLPMWTILGLGAAIIAAPFGLSTSASFSLVNGGTASYVWGWLFLSVISVCIAASLGEIASVFPTSGGVYVWTAHLAPRKHAQLASFVVGWISLVANILLCLSIAFGEAQLIMAAVSVFRNNTWEPEPWHVVLTHFAVMIVCALINAWGVRANLLEPINTTSIYWTFATVVIICITVLVKADDHRTGAQVFAQWQNASGWPDGWSWFVGLLSPAYVLTGYGTISYLCDEVTHPERAVPRAMVGSVLAASFTGFLFVIPMSFLFPENLSDILDAAAGQPLPVAFSIATGSAGGAFGLLFLILVVGMFAAIGSLTVASRCVWSFSRDNGVPLSSVWRRVDGFHQIPLLSLILNTVVISLLGLIYLGNSGAFSAFTGAATILLGLSYVACVAMSLIDRRRIVKRAPWSLGKLGFPVNSIACAYCLGKVPLAYMTPFSTLGAILHRPILLSHDNRNHSLNHELRQRCRGVLQLVGVRVVLCACSQALHSEYAHTIAIALLMDFEGPQFRHCTASHGRLPIALNHISHSIA